MKGDFGKKLKTILPALLLLTAVSFLLFIYAPVELLMANGYEFCYTIYDIFRYMLPVFLIVIAAGVAVYAIAARMAGRAYDVLLAVLLAVLAALYVQGTFFAGDLPPLDGRRIDWADYDHQRIISALILLAALALAFLLLKKLDSAKLRKAAAIAGGAVTGILAVTTAMLIIQTGSYDPPRTIVHTAYGETDMSENENFVIFLVDAVDGETFREVKSAHPEYDDIFDGFTSFTNVISAYPYTSRSIPFMLTGKWFENEREFSDYCEDAFASSPFLKALQKKNYRMGFYDPEFFYIESLADIFENVMEGSRLAYPDRFVKMQLMMAGYRYFPYGLKKLCFLTPDDVYIDTLIENPSLDEERYSMVNDTFFERLKEKDINVGKDDCFRFIYIRGAHEPFIYKSSAEPEWDCTYRSSAEYSMEIVSEYLSKLKAAGVYDNSVIMVMADHGYVEDDVPFGRQNPFMLVKGRGEKHSLVENDLPVSHDDLQTAYSRLLEGKSSETAFAAFDDAQTDSSGRRFLFFEYMKEDHMTEYCQTGHASDETTLIPTGKEFNRE